MQYHNIFPFERRGVLTELLQTATEFLREKKKTSKQQQKQQQQCLKNKASEKH